MTKLTNEQAKELFLQGDTIWTPIKCECCTEDIHYTYLDLSQGDTLEDLEEGNKELYI